MLRSQDLTEPVVKAKDGDSGAMSELLERCYRDLYFFALQTVKDPDIAANAVQGSCIEIINTLGKLRDPGAFLSERLRTA